MQNAPRELSAILLTFIKQLFVVKTFVLSILVGVLHRFYCNILAPILYLSIIIISFL